MRIQFLQDYRGELTGEQFFRAGEQADVDPAVAARLVADERAAYVDDPDEELSPISADELAPADGDQVTGDGSGEALPSIGDPAEERQMPAPRSRRR